MTGWNPLKIWMFDEMYIRFGAEDYDMDFIYNRFMHLTNNSITKHSTSEIKFKGNMWTQEDFISYIKSECGEDMWNKKILGKIKKIIIKSLQSAEDSVVHRENSFEIFGYDFMIDANLRPWLIEINTSPAMDYSTVCYFDLILIGSN